MDYVKFGTVVADPTTLLPSTGYMEGLGYTNQSQSAMIATDFIGLGLPDYLWYQLVNLFYKIDATFDTEMNCDDSIGGACRLTAECSTYTELWSAGWTF